MDIEKLKTHIKLCRKNLKSKRVKCCADCPFEEEILFYYPEMKSMFAEKRNFLEQEKIKK